MNIPDELPPKKIVVSKPNETTNNENSKQSAKEEDDLKAVFETMQKHKKTDVLDKPVIKEETLQPDPVPEAEGGSRHESETESEYKSEAESEFKSEFESEFASETDFTAETMEKKKTPIAADGLIQVQMCIMHCRR